MRLPEDYKRADGSVPTGTEWEFEDAYAGYKLNGTPDLYVYRKTANPTIEVTSEESLEEWRRQKRALDLFFERWFRDHDGAFKAGFNTFKRDDEFGKMLEQHLEKVINQRIQRQEGYSAEEERKITWFEGSPFRGLSAFQPEHAPVFFGRELETREITDRLMAQSGAGKVFLMILGMSGCGKSSLVRAGVLPALLQPGAVPGVDCWRWLILRPGEVQDDLVAGLAHGLLSSQALPELEMLGFNVPQLSSLLSEAPAHAIPPLDAALRQAGRQAGAERMLTGTLTCRLLVIVDQLEELFTLERFDPGQRQRFIRALGSLCRSGLAWIVTTMRSDLYARCGEVEELGRTRQNQLTLAASTLNKLRKAWRGPGGARQAPGCAGSLPARPGNRQTSGRTRQIQLTLAERSLGELQQCWRCPAGAKQVPRCPGRLPARAGYRQTPGRTRQIELRLAARSLGELRQGWRRPGGARQAPGCAGCLPARPDDR
jgi:hypothetical protein